MNAAVALIEKDVALERWNGLLQSLAEGATLSEAMERHGILQRELESIVLGSPVESQRWREAKLLGTASRFSLLDRDELFSRIAAGAEVERAITEVRGGESAERDLADFFELVEALPEWQERFAAAQRAKGLRDMQRVEAIAEDTSRDTLDTLKGPIPNMAAVGRDKLRVEALQWRLARLDPERWGERKQSVNVQVNVSHAETLEAARTRAKVRDGAPKITREVIDAAFTAAPADSTPVADQPVAAADAGNPFGGLED
jgi:hypothetical protein